MLPFSLTPEQAVTWVTLAGTAVGVIAWVRKKTRPTIMKLKQMGEDWVGVPDRPGVPGRAGVMPQLAEFRQKLEEVEKIATEARYHSMPNGGNSAYDKLTQKIEQNRELASAENKQVREDTGTLIRTLAEHTNNLETLNERMSASEADRAGIHREISVFKFGGTERQQT